MLRVRDTKDELILRESASGSPVLGGAFVLVGVFLYLVAAVATLTCERATDSCTLERSGLRSHEARAFRLADIERAAVYEYTSSEGGLTYSLAIETAGEVVHFLSFASGSGAQQHSAAAEINAFLGDPQVASLIAKRDERGTMHLLAGIFGGVGLLLVVLLAGPVTVVFDRFSRTVTRTGGGRLTRSGVTLTLDEVAGVVIVETPVGAGGEYALALRQASGTRIQLSGAYTPDLAGKRDTAERIRDFLGLPPVEEQLRPGVRPVRTQVKEAVAQLDDSLHEAAQDLVREGAVLLPTSGSAIGRMAANLPSRALAVLVDFGMLSIIAWALSNAGFEVKAWVGAWTLVAFGYYTLYEGSTGATIGKRIFAMQVVQLDGSPITWNQAFVRNAVRFIDALGFYLVGGLVALRSPARQRLGDRLAGTVVVWKRAIPAIEEAAERAGRDRF